MKRNLILVAILAMLTASCLMLVACDKQDEQIANPAPPVDVTNMSLGQVHNAAAEVMIQMTEGTIEERTMRTLQILYPQATETEVVQVRALFHEGNLANVMEPEQLQILEEMRLASMSVEFGDYKALEAMHDKFYVKYADKSEMIDRFMDMHGATFDFWTEYYAMYPDKRPEIGSLGTVIDTGVALLVGSRCGPIIGGIFGAACSIAWMQEAAGCMGGCVYAPYYGPNPWCC
jgi:hypothetical protein